MFQVLLINAATEQFSHASSYFRVSLQEVQRTMNQTLQSFDQYWQIMPKVEKPSAVAVLMHGNQYKLRGPYVQVCDSPLATFIEKDTVTKEWFKKWQQANGHQAEWETFKNEGKYRNEWQRIAAVNRWSIAVVAPVLKKKGPWDPEDVFAFSMRLRSLYEYSKRVYLVGVSLGGIGALRTLEVAAKRNVPSPFAALAVAAPGCPLVDKRSTTNDNLCTAHINVLPPLEAVQSLAMRLRQTKTPILIMHGTQDAIVNPKFTLRLQTEVNKCQLSPNVYGGRAAEKSCQVWVKMIEGGRHTGGTFSEAFSRDFSAWSWLNRHDQESPFARPRECAGNPAKSSADSDFPCWMSGMTEPWGGFEDPEYQN